MRYRARIDSNQTEITKKLRELGFSVLCLHMVGRGCPDLLIGKNGQNWLIELKSSQKAQLTPDEERFFSEWQGNAIIAHSVEEIMSKTQV